MQLINENNHFNVEVLSIFTNELNKLKKDNESLLIRISELIKDKYEITKEKELLQNIIKSKYT